MPDDIEQRLATAAEALREYEVAVQQCAELRARTDEMTTQLEALRAQHIHEQKDVERLEGLSLTRILATLRGARDDALARERAEADAVSYRVAEAEARLEVMRREHDVSQIRLSQLSAAPVIYTAALQEKERHLTALGGALGERLLELAEERGRLTGDLREVAEALRAASSAQEALSAVGNTLDSASNWSTYDTFFGGGVISSAVKHSRLDEAAQAAAHADQQTLRASDRARGCRWRRTESFPAGCRRSHPVC